MTKTKRHGRRKKVTTDRLSTLLDDVLMHVLSFLSTKEAVRTSVLARRWKNNWISVPVLNFNLNDFLTDSSDLDDDEKWEECEDKLEHFVYKVLENRGPSYLDKFQYHSCIGVNNSIASVEWLDQAALLMPRVISVFIERGNGLHIPDLDFSCASLQELEILLNTSGLRTIIRTKSIDLPSLKVLKLQDVYLEDDFGQKLFSGCPSLESLYLGTSDLVFSDIFSKVLKTLALEECCQFYHMKICCPSLISLNIECCYQTGGISLKSTASLANANISLESNDDGDVDDLNILEGLSNVSILKLDLRSDELKEELMEYIPSKIFNNLKTMELGRLNLKDSNLVAFFLRCSPHLQMLTLNLAEDKINAALPQQISKISTRGSIRMGKPSEGDEDEPSQAESGEVFQREYLETVKIIKRNDYKIIKWKNQDILLIQVIKYLRAHIKKIEKILTT